MFIRDASGPAFFEGMLLLIWRGTWIDRHVGRTKGTRASIIPTFSFSWFTRLDFWIAFAHTAKLIHQKIKPRSQCTFCHMKGHIERDCLKKQYQENLKKSPPENPRVATITCTFCKKGHSIKECCKLKYKKKTDNFTIDHLLSHLGFAGSSNKHTLAPVARQ